MEEFGEIILIFLSSSLTVNSSSVVVNVLLEKTREKFIQPSLEHFLLMSWRRQIASPSRCFKSVSNVP